MYISKIDSKKMEISLGNRHYPKETIVCCHDSGDIVPLHVIVKQSKPVSGRKIIIEVMDNGYIIALEDKVKICSFKTAALIAGIDDYLNEKTQTTRSLKQEELIDKDLLSALAEIQEYYNHKED